MHLDAEQRLAADGLRYTEGRRSLVTVLATARRPLTLPEIVSFAPEVPQSSAYRNLDSLEQGGVVHRISVGRDRAYYELAESLLGHHHHLICVSCGAIEDMHLDGALEAQVDAALASAARGAGFVPLHHNLDLYGRCASCASSPPSGER